MKQTSLEQSLFDRINSPEDASALDQSFAIQKACAEVGFDWNAIGPVSEKVAEELAEVLEEALMLDVQQARVDEEIGDLLFAVVNLARHLGTNPEAALQNANKKFEKRFRQVEIKLQEKGKTLPESGLNEMEKLWKEIKNEENEKQN